MCEVTKIRLSEKMAKGVIAEPPPLAETAAEVRVVRCPKCKKLLPELVGVNVYRCGGCNAALQANKSAAVMVMGTCLEKSDDDRSNTSENVGAISCKQKIPSNAYQEIDEGIHEFEGKEKMFPVRDGGSTETFASEANPIDEHGPGKINFPSTGKRNAPYWYPSEDFSIGDSSLDLDQAVIADSEECNGNKRQGNGAYMAQKRCQSTVNKSQEPQGVSGPWRMMMNSSSYGIRLSPCPDEGSSNCRQSSMYDHDVDHPKYWSHGLPYSVEHLEQDRTELLKKLDELRDHLSRSCEIKDLPTRRLPTRTAPVDHQEHHGTDDLVHDYPPSSNEPSTRNFPLLNEHDPNLQHYQSALNHDEFLGYRGPFGFPLRRTPTHLSPQYPEELPNSYLNGFYSPDSLVPYHANDFQHQPTCSKLNLHNEHFHMPSRCPLTSFGNRSAPYLTTCHESYPVDDPAEAGIANNSRRNATSVLSHNPSIPQGSIFNRQNGRGYHPTSVGAPFIVCSNCYQPMQVPYKLLLRDKDRHKLRCGSCSHIISFEVDGNHLIVSDSAPNFGTTLDPRNKSSEGRTESVNHGIYKNGTIVFPVSEDYDSSNYNVYSADENFILSSPTLDVASHEMVERKYGMNLAESKNVEGLYSSSSASKEGRIIDSVIYQREKSTSAELSQKSDTTSRGASIPLREHFGCSSFNHGGNQSETGCRSTRSEQDKVVSSNASFKQNSMKDILMATEMDFPADEYPNHVLSQNSTESYEDDFPRMSKGGELFLTGLIKKGFRDMSRTNQSLENGRFKVSVNGHQIPDRLIKKVEKKTGPIQPGDYWYDYRAGFWSAMGHPCIGIIPPFIEEFNYPMPKNCSGGNTGVIVNGRELHKKDLDLLAGRGLPTSRSNSYVIEISGRVLDAVTGEELDCLGKLAPTVEKVKHGFGMRVPGVAAA